MPNNVEKILRYYDDVHEKRTNQDFDICMLTAPVSRLLGASVRTVRLTPRAVFSLFRSRGTHGRAKHILECVPSVLRNPDSIRTLPAKRGGKRYLFERTVPQHAVIVLELGKDTRGHLVITAFFTTPRYVKKFPVLYEKQKPPR